MSCAKDIMTTKLITLKEDESISKAISILIEKRISGIPVVDDDMHILGLLSEKDLLELIFYDSIEDVKVSEFMSRDVVAFDADSELLDVCEFLMGSSYKRVPIVTDNKLVGIISRRDMIRYILNR